jgi:hypothetical protein
MLLTPHLACVNDAAFPFIALLFVWLLWLYVNSEVRDSLSDSIVCFLICEMIAAIIISWCGRDYG